MQMLCMKSLELYTHTRSLLGVPYLEEPKQSPLDRLHAPLLPLDAGPGNGKRSGRDARPIGQTVEVKKPQIREEQRYSTIRASCSGCRLRLQLRRRLWWQLAVDGEWAFGGLADAIGARALVCGRHAGQDCYVKGSIDSFIISAFFFGCCRRKERKTESKEAARCCCQRRLTLEVDAQESGPMVGCRVSADCRATYTVLRETCREHPMQRSVISLKLLDFMLEFRLHYNF